MTDLYSQAWQERIQHFDKVFWDKEAELWSDRIIGSSQYVPGFYASSTVPLYMLNLANINSTRESIVLRTLQRLGVLNYPGGLPTSLNSTSKQQWDFPNAWPPLQWFLVKAWRDSSDVLLREAAEELAISWLNSNYAGWLRYNGSMFEKVIDWSFHLMAYY